MLIHIPKDNSSEQLNDFSIDRKAHIYNLLGLAIVYVLTWYGFLQLPTYIKSHIVM